MSNRNRRPLPASVLPQPDGDEVQDAVPESTEQAQPEPEALHALESIPPEEPRYQAALSAEEIINIRRVNDAVDFLTADIKTREAGIASLEEAIARDRKDVAILKAGRDAAQRNLIDYIRAAIVAYGLAPGVMYRADIESGQLVPVGPTQQLPQ